MKTVLSKAEFAKHVGRSRSCISGWIKAGKISANALIGDGRNARIWVQRAKDDLARSLDPAQQVSQAAPIAFDATEMPLTADDGPNRGLLPIAIPSERERDLARRAKADADKAEHDAEAARRRLAIDEGRYVLAEEAAAAWGREMSKHIADTEMFIGTKLPQLIAERHGLDWKILASEMRSDYRDFRMTASEDARARREATEQERRDNA
jgi:hypothetical protein